MKYYLNNCWNINTSITVTLLKQKQFLNQLFYFPMYPYWYALNKRKSCQLIELSWNAFIILLQNHHVSVFFPLFIRFLLKACLQFTRLATSSKEINAWKIAFHLSEAFFLLERNFPQEIKSRRKHIRIDWKLR